MSLRVSPIAGLDSMVFALAIGALACSGGAADAGPLYATASVNGTTLAYDVRGTGPALVLVHGGGFDRRLWDRQADVFAEHFRVIRYDVRGVGRSGSNGAS